MSFDIDVGKVHAVLLADGWHSVVEDSFELGDYKYTAGESAPGVRALSTGFMFTEHLPASTAQSGRRIMTKGPISSILAVREKA